MYMRPNIITSENTMSSLFELNSSQYINGKWMEELVIVNKW